jgi:hypothetical protein
VRLSNGQELEVDAAEPDLLAILEALYRQVTLERSLDAYDDKMKEIRHFVAQLLPEERDAYLVESLFSASVRYENELFEAYERKLAEGASRRKGRGRATGQA